MGNWDNFNWCHFIQRPVLLAFLWAAVCCQLSTWPLCMEGGDWILTALRCRYYWAWYAFVEGKVNQRYFFKLTYSKTICFLLTIWVSCLSFLLGQIVSLRKKEPWVINLLKLKWQRVDLILKLWGTVLQALETSQLTKVLEN